MISRRTLVTSPPVRSFLLISLRRRIASRRARSAERIDQDSLRTAGSANGSQAVVANPVVDSSPRYAEQFGSVVQRNAAADMWFELALGVGGHPGSLTLSINARWVPTADRTQIWYVSG